MAGAKMHNSIVEEWRILRATATDATKFLKQNYAQNARETGGLVETLITQIETIVRLNWTDARITGTR